MRLGIRGLWLLLSMATTQGAFAGDTLYGSSKNGELFTINVTTGVGTLVGVLPSGTFCPAIGITEIEFSNLSRRAFAQCQDGGFTGFEFNVTNASAIGATIPNAGSYTGLETVGATWYGTAIFGGGGSSPSQLRTIDPFTGTSTLVGATGVGPIAGLAYNTVTGTMYGIGGGPAPANLYTINLSTGAATVVGSTGIQAGSLEFGPSGILYAGGTGLTDGGKLFEINLGTGAGSLVGATGFASVTGLTLVGCNPFQNCSFETGDFTGWVTQDLSSPFFPLRVGGAGITPGFDFFSSAPTDGSFAALHGFDGNGPGHIRVAQDVLVAAGASLNFDYRAAWNLTDFCVGCADRTFDVLVEPVGGGAPLASTRILTAQAETTNLDTGNQLGTVDLSAFVGQTVRVVFDWFVPETFTGPAFFQLDNVRTTTGYFSVTPCRVADTRNPPGPSGGPALGANTTRTFPVSGTCAIPSTAKAVAINVTVVGETDLGDLRLYPAGSPAPAASTINFAVGKARANNAIVSLGTGGQITVQCDMAAGSTGQTHFLFDVYGYFQ